MSREREKKSLRIETLEARAMMDGNVTVSFVGDTLFVRGDSRANDVEIRALPGTQAETGAQAATAEQVTQWEVRGNNNTTINRSQDAFVSGPADVKNIVVDLKNGNNRLTFNKPAATTEPGTNSDQATISAPATIAGGLNIKTGSGGDTIDLENLAIGGDLALATGNRQDTVKVQSVSVGRRATISTASGDDFVDINGLAVDAAFTLDAGQGNDQITFHGTDEGEDADANAIAAVLNAMDGALTIRGGTGHDTVELDHVQATDFLLDLAQGNDLLRLKGDNALGGAQKPAMLIGGPNSDRIEQIAPIVSSAPDTPDAPIVENAFPATPLVSGFEDLGGLSGTIVGRRGKAARA